MFDRFSRSWALVKASAAVLRQDKELLVFPLVSSIALAITVASFVVPLFAAGWWSDFAADHHPSPALALWAFGFYFVQYTVMFFFNAALVGAAMIRLRGGDPTVADGFRIAFSKLPAILGYAAIAATVGMILRGVEERAGIVGRIVTGMLGAAWTFATFLTVPVLVSESLGPIDAVRRSAMLLKQTWGENLIGNAGIGLSFGLLIAFVLVTGFGLGIGAGVLTQNFAALVPFAALAIGVAMILVLVHAALSGIYSAALYCYAEHGKVAGGFDQALLEEAFAQRR